MARGELAGLMLDQRRHLLGADRELRNRTTRVEDAAAWRIQRRGDVALQQDALLVRRRIGHRNRGEQRLRVRVQRRGVEAGLFFVVCAKSGSALATQAMISNRRTAKFM